MTRNIPQHSIHSLAYPFPRALRVRSVCATTSLDRGIARPLVRSKGQGLGGKTACDLSPLAQGNTSWSCVVSAFSLTHAQSHEPLHCGSAVVRVFPFTRRWWSRGSSDSHNKRTILICGSPGQVPEVVEIAFCLMWSAVEVQVLL